jgi:diguanylate cyclase (GGDEF)-like protein/PAS domain S-box-containing protein
MSDDRAMTAPVLVIEASLTRQHVLRRVLAARFPQVTFCRTPSAALEILRDGADRLSGGALLLAMETVPPPYTDELLALLATPACQELAVLVLAHVAERDRVEWASRRPRSAVLLWEDFTDSADCLAKMLDAPASPPPRGHEVPAGSIRLLLVDDSRTVRASYARLLGEQGYTVEAAGNAAEAYGKARAQNFDIAVIDYFMPGENGDVLCQRLRADPRTAGITVAILTGTYHDQVIQDSLRAGAVECMFKNEAQELFLARLGAMARMVRAQKSVEAERSRLSGILASVGDGVYGVDRSGTITFMNPAARTILGFDGPAASSGAHALFHHAHGDGTPNPPGECRLQRAYASGDALHGWETTFWRRDGRPVPVECTVYPLRIDDRLEGSVVAFRDVSERRTLEQELLWQANHDPLTKLHNRRYFEKQLDEEVARCQRDSHSALLYLDLDRFKYINDTAGHAAGDQLLVEISQLMRERLRGTDLLARLGGDEFAVILRDIASDQVLLAAESFRDMLERYTFVYGGRQYRIYGSIGAAVLGAHTPSAGEALANADIACHIAKNKGRNQSHVYEPDSDARRAMNTELGWSARLQRALRDNRFELHFQPIVPIRDLARISGDPNGGSGCIERFAEDGVLHCEALLRLADGPANPVSPNAFLPTAERFGLMPHIDLWVVTRAVEQWAALASDGIRARFAVNLSGHALDHSQFASQVRHLLIEHNVEPGSLVFEITETNAIANMDAAQRLIAELREHGCRFALDDFGSGFSSFHHLKHLPVDYVKIDGQFVRGMVRDPADRAIVVSINDIAHSFGKRTVAEFVENRATLEMLHACGVDYAQGYYLSRPRPMSAMR